MKKFQIKFTTFTNKNVITMDITIPIPKGYITHAYYLAEVIKTVSEMFQIKEVRNLKEIDYVIDLHGLSDNG